MVLRRHFLTYLLIYIVLHLACNIREWISPAHG